jgi:hypothetical protein
LDEWTNAEGVQKRGLSVMSWHARLSEIGRAKPAPARKPKPAAANGEPFHPDPIGF